MTAEETLPQVSIAVPGDWIIFNLQAMQDSETVASLIDERIKDDVLRADSRDEAMAIVSRVGSYATEHDVWFAAAYVAEDEAGPVVISLTATVMRLPLPDLQELDAKDAGTDDVDVRLNGQSEASAAPATTAGGEFHNAVTTQVVLNAGPAVRVERVASFPTAGDDRMSQEIYTVQYVLPLDEDGLTLTVTAISPSIRRKSQIDLVLDEIADTVTVTRD